MGQTGFLGEGLKYVVYGLFAEPADANAVWTRRTKQRAALVASTPKPSHQMRPSRVSKVDDSFLVALSTNSKGCTLFEDIVDIEAHELSPAKATTNAYSNDCGISDTERERSITSGDKANDLDGFEAAAPADSISANRPEVNGSCQCVGVN
jgi:hypothetical protein